ncbi:hypothetical protein D3C72_1912910 [compost metagenome]
MPFTRSAGIATTTPTAADSAADASSASGNGTPMFVSTPCVYAPVPRNAACPMENCPVKPASSISPRPTMP